MKTVLIPTDFKVESLRIIDSLVFTNKPENVTIIFMHAFKLSDSITDLLMLSRRSREYEDVPDEFYQQIEVYKSKYSNHIKFVAIEYFYGGTVAAFNNFIEGLNADCIAYTKSYQFHPINKYSIDPGLLTKRCCCEVIELDIQEYSKEEKLYDTMIPAENRKSVIA